MTSSLAVNISKSRSEALVAGCYKVTARHAQAYASYIHPLPFSPLEKESRFQLAFMSKGN